MKLTTFCFLSLLLVSTSVARWVSVRLASNEWVALNEVTPRERFLLHPQAVVTKLKLTTGCTKDKPTKATVQLWEQKILDEADDAIRKSNMCNGSCRVEPYQARHIIMESRTGGLKARRNQISIPLTLPKTIDFEFDRVRRSRCAYIGVQDIGGMVIGIPNSLKKSASIVLSLDTSRLEPSTKSSRDLYAPEKDNTTLRQEAAAKMEKELTSLRVSVAASKQNLKVKQEAEAQCLDLKKPLSVLVKSPLGTSTISDCLDVKLRGLKTGIYFLKPPGREVLCTATGELVVLRRTKNDVNFTKDWITYRSGLGDPKKGDFFSGLDLLSMYTASGDRCMRVVLVPKNEKFPPRMGQYSKFLVGPENNNFALNYKDVNGSLTYDPFAFHRGAKFATFDHPWRHRCATQYRSGNWYSSCSYINLFAEFNKDFSSNGLLPGNDKFMKAKLKSAYMTLRKPGGDPTALVTLLSTDSSSCPAKLQQWLVPESGEFLITVGGAAGGTSPHFNSRNGGRGAVVKVRVSLKGGTKLRFVAGCPGRTGHVSGAGGDGSFVANLNSQKLIAAAGGGGGAGWTDGGHGRRENSGGPPILKADSRNSKVVLNTTAFGWKDIGENLFFGDLGKVVSTGGRTHMDSFAYSFAAGGGGGWEPGKGAEERRVKGAEVEPKQSAGGGGGSGCGDGTLSCELEGGGNTRRGGFVTIAVYRCF